jgi:hypothetical protein
MTVAILSSQPSADPHIHVDACTRLGITLCSNLPGGAPINVVNP